jgi:hypothetical protein
MTIQSNSKYLEKYAMDYSEMVCDRFFSTRKFMTGQDIVQLTGCIQVNFFVIKRLFELWQEELGKLKSNPFFDYRDVAVHEALTQFMNVLSRRIKVERVHLQPMLQSAVSQAVSLALDPVSFYQNEVSKAPLGKVNDYLRENKKYYKWHDKVITFLIDKAGFVQENKAYLEAIASNHEIIKDSLESFDQLLATLDDPLPFDLLTYYEEIYPEEKSEESILALQASELIDSEKDELIKGIEAVPSGTNPIAQSEFSDPEINGDQMSQLDSQTLKASFETESYRWMPGINGTLADSLTLNQRFMLAKELFQGDVEQLKEALNAIDKSTSFDEAVNLVSTRYVDDLGWDTHSEAVNEFLQLIYRRFPD